MAFVEQPLDAHQLLRIRTDNQRRSTGEESAQNTGDEQSPSFTPIVIVKLSDAGDENREYAGNDRILAVSEGLRAIARRPPPFIVGGW